MDLNKIIPFKCAFDELENGEEPKDTVDCNKLWEDIEFYPVQYFTEIVSMLAMFGQFFIYIFSCQATYLRYI